ncbi:unnamed protein product [Blepharisma stoltei]|uniref:Uncharacterized protein n=1 Tax=Blepharisma stoltei TaxID=1481888 RepID=A0AAU9I3J4_9CILI|nr:unnamed protein product [Blepharisma stoltei]
MLPNFQHLSPIRLIKEKVIVLSIISKKKIKFTERINKKNMDLNETLARLLLGYTNNSCRKNIKCSFDNLISKNFWCKRGKFKKDYLRCKLIRGHKRLMRQMKVGRVPKKGLNCYDETLSSSQELFQRLKDCYNEDKPKFNKISKTENGPITDGNDKNPNSRSVNSFNKGFCKGYFEDPIVRRSYYYYTEYLFSNLDPEVLCKKFEINCCESEQHECYCSLKWTIMKTYISQSLIKEIDLEPWKPENPCSIVLPDISRMMLPFC